MTKRRISRQSLASRQKRRLRVLRFALLGVFVMLAMIAVGCDELIQDVLAGEDCGHHGVCERHAAAAGLAAGAAGAAGGLLQRREDGPFPWDEDEDELLNDLDFELDNAFEDTDGARVNHLQTGPSDGSDALTLDTDESIEDILGPDAEVTPGTGDEKIPDDGTAPWDREEPPPGTGKDTGAEGNKQPDTSGRDEGEEATEDSGDYAEEPDEGGEEGAEAAEEAPEEGAEQAGEGEEKAEPVSPAERYEPLTTVGNVTILMDPETNKIAIQGGKYIGGKDQNGYWVTDNNKIVQVDPDTGKYTVSDGHFTATHEGCTYTVTKDNKVFIYDHVNEGMTVSDGHFTATREGNIYGVTKDNKIVAYDSESGEFAVTDGHFTATHEGTQYVVTKDNKIASYDEATGNIKISDGHFTATREGTTYTVTDDNKVIMYDEATGAVKVSDGHFTATREGTTYTVTRDNKIVAYDEATGNIKVSDGHFTATREGTVYSVTKDNKILTYNEASGDFKVSDGHYVLEREGGTTVFTKDNVEIQYDEDTHGVMVSTTGRRGSLTVGAGEDGQFALDTTVKGSMDGTPTTFGVTATKYNLPETGQQGFAGGLSLEQEDFGFQASYLKEPTETGFGLDVRSEEWTAGFHRLGDTKSYSVGYGDFKVIREEGLGGSTTMGAWTGRF